MTAIGGSIESVTLAGEEFSVAENEKQSRLGRWGNTMGYYKTRYHKMGCYKTGYHNLRYLLEPPCKRQSLFSLRQGYALNIQAEFKLAQYSDNCECLILALKISDAISPRYMEITTVWGIESP